VSLTLALHPIHAVVLPQFFTLFDMPPNNVQQCLIEEHFHRVAAIKIHSSDFYNCTDNFHVRSIPNHLLTYIPAGVPPVFSMCGVLGKKLNTSKCSMV